MVTSMTMNRAQGQACWQVERCWVPWELIPMGLSHKEKPRSHSALLNTPLLTFLNTHSWVINHIDKFLPRDGNQEARASLLASGGIGTKEDIPPVEPVKTGMCWPFTPKENHHQGRKVPLGFERLNCLFTSIKAFLLTSSPPYTPGTSLY